MKPKGKMTLDLSCVKDAAKIHLYFSGALQEELWRAILLFLSFLLLYTAYSCQIVSSPFFHHICYILED